MNFEGADARKMPTAAADLVRAFVRGEELGPVARLQTLRRGVRISDDAGTPLAMVTDDEVSVMDGRRVASRFRELEVELDPAADAALSEVLIGRLRQAGAGPVDNIPKIVRALGPRAAAPPDLEIPELDEHADVTEIVRRELATSVMRLLRRDAGVRLGEDPEEVHQARVATRRVRSALRTFRDVLEPEWAASLRDRLRWLADALGDVRDTEVLRDRIRSREPMLPETDRKGLEELVTMVEMKRDEVRERLLRAMREPAYLALLDELVEAARRRATEGGSYRVVVSLTRTVLWLLSLGIFDKEYAAATAGSSDEHTYVAPDLFTAETPLGTYQGMTDQVVMSRTKESYRTVLAPHGSSKPHWLEP